MKPWIEMNICKICNCIMFKDPHYPMDEIYFCPRCGHKSNDVDESKEEEYE